MPNHNPSNPKGRPRRGPTFVEKTIRPHLTSERSNVCKLTLNSYLLNRRRGDKRVPLSRQIKHSDMTQFPRQRSLYALLSVGRILELTPAHFAVTDGGNLSRARVFFKSSNGTPDIPPMGRFPHALAVFTGLTLATLWLCWFFRSII